MAFRVAFLMPEFPGHTHTWLWREICGLREHGLDVHLASTRPPSAEDLARHAFAGQVEGRVFYAWPPSLRDVLAFPLACLAAPVRTLRCVSYARALKRDGGKKFTANLALLLPAWRFARWCRANRIEHIHVATPANSLIVAQMAGILAGLATDVTINAKLEWWGGAMKEKLARCAAIFPVADWMAEQIRREHPAPTAARVRVARHGVDTQTWRPPTDRTKRNSPFEVITIGRLHPAKGHDDLIRAAAILRERGREVRLVIIGGGADRPRLEELVRDDGLGDHVELTGALDEAAVRDRLGRADAFALASHAEALGVVFMEAMASGTPVIASATDGGSEIVDDGVTGLIVPIKNPAAIADAIERLIDEPDLHRSLAEAGLRTVRERFDSRVGAGAVAGTIKAIIDARRAERSSVR